MKKLLSLILIFAMITTTFVMPATEVKAEIIKEIYDTEDPKAFMEALGKYDALFANGHIYFVTKAKLASNPNATRYKSIGYTITVTNGTYTLEVEIDSRDGMYYNTINSVTYEDDTVYTIRAISYDDIVLLCKNKAGENNAAFKSIFSTSRIQIRIDAIMTVIINGEQQGDIIAEDGKGNITPQGKIFRLKNTSELNELKDYGFSTDFSSYRNINSYVTNNPLTINYYADTKAISPSYNNTSSSSFPTSTAASVSGTGLSIASNGLIDGSTQSLYQFQSITLKTTSNLGLKKTGYYLPSGSEWKDADGNVFTAGKTYTASQIDWAVTSGAASTNLYANWKPISYQIKYDANGGSGSMSAETHTFDEAYFTPAGNTFTRRGYTFTGWALKDSSGNFVPITASMVNDSSDISLAGLIEPGTLLRNLTTTNGAVLTLEAQWEPNEYEITLNPQAPAGTTMTDYTKKLYILFDTCFSLASGGTSITSLKLPTITGYNFLGYFEGSGEGTEDSALIKKDANNSALGLFNFTKTTYDQDKTFLGQWEPIQSTVTLKADTVTVKEGKEITPVTQTLTATYGEDMPKATMPSNPGYTFMGFYTGKNRTGTNSGDVIICCKIS